MNQTESLFSSSAGSVAVIALLLAILALGGVVWLLARQQRLLGQYQHLMTGTSGANLEATLNEHISQVRETIGRVEAVDQRIEKVEDTQQFGLQHLGMVRYNPFRDTGGNQSFAIALLDGRGYGFVLSSLHSRDMTRVYAKSVEQWQSAHSLTDEEQEALSMARQSQA
jgi:hypothetical protein